MLVVRGLPAAILLLVCSGSLAGAAAYPRQRLHEHRLRQPRRGHEQARSESAQIRISLSDTRRLEGVDAGMVSGSAQTQVGASSAEGRDIQNTQRSVSITGEKAMR